MALYKQPGSKVFSYDFTVAGKRYRGTTQQRTKARAEAFEAELRTRARERGPSYFAPRRAITLRELSVRYAAWIEEAQLAPKTRTYYSQGRRMLEATPLADMLISHINSEMVERTKFTCTKWADGESRIEEASPAYANQAICTLKTMLSKARDWSLIAEAPRFKKRKAFGRSKMIGPHEEAALLAVASQPLVDVLMICMDTGMRPAEVYAMRWEDVDFRARQIFIPHSKTPTGRRQVPISGRMTTLLAARHNGQAAGWVFPSDSKSGHLESVSKAFQAARRRAGLDPRIVLYSARHTFGTYALASTGNLPAVMQTMGHASVRSTLPYQHHNSDAIRDVIEQRNSAAPNDLRHSLRHSPRHSGGLVM